MNVRGVKGATVDNTRGVSHVGRMTLNSTFRRPPSLLLGAIALGAITPLLLASTAATAGAQTAATTARTAGRQLDSLAEAYYEELLPLNPTTATAAGDHR